MLNVMLESALRSLILALTVGLGLWISRVRNPRLQTTSWTLVLACALFMPLLMQWRTIEIRTPQHMVATTPVVLRTVRAGAPGTPLPPVPLVQRIDWRSVTWRVYVSVAAVLLARLLAGLWLTFQLWRSARPVPELQAGCRVRESAGVSAPVTFGSTILLPGAWRDWVDAKLRAVIAHERAHVTWGDFYAQLAAKLHVSIFWFSPMAWWLERRLIQVAETASDDAALEMIDRSTYAEMLLSLARKTQLSAGVAMARPATVKQRVERILSGVARPSHANWKRFVLASACVSLTAAIVAGLSVHAQQQPAPPDHASPDAAPAPKSPEPPEAQDRPLSSDRGAYAIVSGDSISIAGSEKDAKRARSFRGTVSGDYLWFSRGGKDYIITDPATVQRARELMPSEKELYRGEAELREIQSRLQAEQVLPEAEEAEARAKVLLGDAELKHVLENVRELSAAQPELAELQKELETAKIKELSQDTLSALTAKTAELQSKLSGDALQQFQARLQNLEAQMAEIRQKLGSQHVLLEQRLADLTREQAEKAEEQAKRSAETSRRLRELFEDSMQKGLAQPAR